MIVYFSYPYAINDGVSQRHAITQLQKHIGRFKRMNPRLTAVNALVSAYDNPDLGSKNKVVTDDKMIFSAARLLLDSSNMHVMIKAKGVGVRRSYEERVRLLPYLQEDSSR